MDIKSYLKSRGRTVDAALNRYLPIGKAYPSVIHEAMRYSVFAGGKRIRPILAIMTAETLGYKAERVLPAACSLELIHTYSLIHDDLPCMDDDDFRRGKPTNHKVFGEAVAVLSGDALLTYAFELITKNAGVKGVKPAAVIEALRLIAAASGTGGMVGGQVVDMLSEKQEPSLPVLQYIHTHKTGALILAPIMAAAELCGAGEREKKALKSYGENLGLLFQIVDDILNVVGDAGKLGKSVGSDAARKKVTYPALFGIDESRQRAGELRKRTAKAAEYFGRKADLLNALSDYVINRES